MLHVLLCFIYFSPGSEKQNNFIQQAQQFIQNIQQNFQGLQNQIQQNIPQGIPGGANGSGEQSAEPVQGGGQQPGNKIYRHIRYLTVKNNNRIN